MEEEIKIFFKDLFPINRSLTGDGNKKTIEYLIDNIIDDGEIKSVRSGTKVFDWKVPPVWNVNKAYVKNKFGEKVIDFKENNLNHLRALLVKKNY